MKNKRVQLFCDDESRTKQSFRDECDINNVIRKWKATGVVTHVRDAMPQYGDFMSVEDYQTSCNKILSAQEAFQGLSSTIRARFANDPAQLLAFVADANNLDEAIKLGLVSAPVVPVSSDAS